MTVKIIETTMSVRQEGTSESYAHKYIDHQSRVIEFNSWQDYISVYVENKFVIANSLFGNMTGAVIPREVRIDDLKYDDFHLSCNVTSYDERFKTRTLAYLIAE